MQAWWRACILISSLWKYSRDFWKEHCYLRNVRTYRTCLVPFLFGENSQLRWKILKQIDFMNPFTFQKYKKKVVLMQKFTLSFCVMRFIGVFLHWRSSACTKSTNSLIKSQLLDLSSLSQRLDVGELVFFLSNKKTKCLKSNLCWFIRIYIFLYIVHVYK